MFNKYFIHIYKYNFLFYEYIIRLCICVRCAFTYPEFEGESDDRQTLPPTHNSHRTTTLKQNIIIKSSIFKVNLQAVFMHKACLKLNIIAHLHYKMGVGQIKTCLNDEDCYEKNQLTSHYLQQIVVCNMWLEQSGRTELSRNKSPISGPLSNINE